MEGWKIGVTIFSGIAVAQGFFLGGYLLIREKFRPTPNFFLGLVVLGIAFRVGKSVCYFVVPDMAEIGIALGGAGLWAIGPSLWLFTKTCKNGSPHQLDYLFYAPSLSLLALAALIDGHHHVTVYRSGYVALMLFLVASLWVFFTHDWNGGKKRFQVFLSGVSLMWVTYIISWFAGNIQWYTFGSAVSSFVLYLFSFFILWDRSILNEPSQKNNGQPLPDDTMEGIVSQLEFLFESEKIYRKKGLTIAAVAHEMERPSYLVSKVINQYFGLKFNDFVNRYRVEEVKVHLRDHERNPTVETIAKEVGFSSTSTMYNAFKKATNLTPQAFRREVKDGS